MRATACVPVGQPAIGTAEWTIEIALADVDFGLILRVLTDILAESAKRVEG